MLNNREKWTTLYDHVTSRLNALEEDTMLKHHVNQWRLFCERAVKCLRDSPSNAETEIVELLATQWQRVDQIAGQYLKSSPDYSSTKALEAFNRQAGGYYQRLREALPEKITGAFQFSAPIFYVAVSPSGLAELTLFRDSLPAFIKIPDINRSESGIAYMAARTFCEQLPGFLPEFQAQIQRQFPARAAMLLPWLPDLAAKLTSLALLFDPAEIIAQLCLPVKLTLTDTAMTDPLSLILPYPGLAALPYLLNHFPGMAASENQASADAIRRLQKDVAQILAERLEPQFQELPDAMFEVVRGMLAEPHPLESLGGKTLLEVLLVLAEAKSEPPAAARTDWGRLAAFAEPQALLDWLRPAGTFPLPLSCCAGLFLSPTESASPELAFSLTDILKAIFG